MYYYSHIKKNTSLVINRDEPTIEELTIRLFHENKKNRECGSMTHYIASILN